MRQSHSARVALPQVQGVRQAPAEAPRQPRGQAGRSALGRVLDVFFGGSLENAVAAHLSDPRRAAKMTPDELRRLSDLIDQAMRQGD